MRASLPAGKNVVVVGAGPGGLASAMLLRAAGAQVTVLERGAQVGGRNGAIRQDGFTFDIGPTFFLYPQVLREIFTACGRSLDDEVEMTRLDPMYRLQFDDGTIFEATPDVDRLTEQVAHIDPVDAMNVPAYLKETASKFTAFSPILRRPFHNLGSLIKGDMAKAFPLFRPWLTVDQDLRRFFKNPDVRLAFSFQSKYLGMSPFKCPSLFTIVAHVEYGFGVYHPTGGCNAVPRAMARVASEMGVDIRLSEPVERLAFEGRRATGAVTAHGEYPADAVVVNGDFATTMKAIVPNSLRRRWTDEKIDAKRYSCSTFMLYLGVEGEFPEMHHHTIHLSRDYLTNIREIDAGLAPDDPTIYVQNASVTDRTLAPEGHSALYILVPVGNLSGGIDWQALAPVYREKILRRTRTSLRTRHSPQHPDRSDVHAGRLAGPARGVPRRDVQSRPQSRTDAALAAAKPVRGSRRRLPDRRGHTSRLRPAHDLRERPDRKPARSGGSRLAWRGDPGNDDAEGGSGMNGTGIIGGGLGGLAAACTLAARGHKVTLLERNGWLGGKAAVLERNGFRFDMGPTILTMPRVLARIFGEAGRDVGEYLDLVRLDPQWRCFYDDGSVLDLAQDPEEMKRTLRSFAPDDVKGYEDFLSVARRLSDVSDRFFFWKSVEDLRDTMDLKSSMSLATLSDVLSLRMHRTVAGQVKRNVRDKRVAQMLEHFIQYVGSSPLASPAVLCGIAQMQVGEGVWYPMGGTRAVPVALTRLAEELGVRLPDGRRGRTDRDGGGTRHGRRDRGWRASPLRPDRIQHGQRADLP